MTQPPFWQPAVARNQAWRTALGFTLVMAIWLAFSAAVVFGGARLIAMTPGEFALGNTWSSAALFFVSFAGFHVGLMVVLPVLHRRRYSSLFGPARRIDMRHFGYGLAATFGLAAALYGLMAIEQLVLPEGAAPDVEQVRPVGAWLAGLVPALALILLQTSAEEALFRGYLLQQLRARFRSVLVWGIGPSLVFGLLHFQPAVYGWVNATAYVVNAAVMGTLAAFVTLRTGNLGAAIGLHFGNNAALVLFGLAGSLEGFSLFVVNADLRSGYMTYSIFSQTVMTVLIFALWWRWMNRHRPIAKPGPGA